MIDLDEAVTRLEKSISRNDEAGILKILQQLIPGFRAEEFMEETQGEYHFDMAIPHP